MSSTDLYEVVNGLKVEEVVVVDVHADAEIQTSISSIKYWINLDINVVPIGILIGFRK